MAFKLPKLPRQSISTPPALVEINDLPTFDYGDVAEKVEIGRGGFATVSVAIYKYDAGHAKRVVIKDVHNLGEDAQKLFIKEARLLNSVQHENIVQFRGFCRSPLAIMMEYVYFDFKPFHRDLKVSSLKEFLNETHSCDGFVHVMPVIASDVARAIEYLHDKDIVHRDLKPANILISNQHYCDISDVATAEKMWSEKPAVCKITDFGESRSELVQTQSLNMAVHTQNLNRGTPAFMAPEIFLPGRARPEHRMSLDNLKKVDIWALGLVCYNMINPSLSAPYMYDLKKANVQPGSYIHYIQNMLSRQQLPSPVPEHVPFQATVWREIYDTFQLCARFEQESRPTAAQVMEKLQSKPPKNAALNKHLKVNQQTAVEKHDREMAGRVQKGLQLQDCNPPSNGWYQRVRVPCHEDCGRNRKHPSAGGCVLSTFDRDSRGRDLSPYAINRFRGIDEFYDAQEAYQLLDRHGLLRAKYDLTEELSPVPAFSSTGRHALVEAITNLCVSDFLSLYNCSPYIFIIGHMRGCLFLLDTHPIGEDLGGNGTGLLKVYEESSQETCKSLCHWILCRLVGKVAHDENQGLAVLYPRLTMRSPRDDHGGGQHESVPRTNHSNSNEDPSSDRSEDASKTVISVHDGGDHASEGDCLSEKIRNNRERHVFEVDSNDSCVNSQAAVDELQTMGENENSEQSSRASNSEPEKSIGGLYLTEECWNNDQRIPMFEKGRPSRYTVPEAVHILSKLSVTSTRKCTRQPLQVRENASFLVDLKWLSDWEDVKADMNGVFTGVLRCGVWTLECDEDSCSVFARKELPLTSPTSFHLIQNSKRNKAAKSLVRSIFLLKDNKGDFVNNVCLLQYNVNNSTGRVEFYVQQHGNCKGAEGNSYYPTKKSTMSEIKVSVERKGSQGVYDALRRSAGGVCGANAASDLPRGKHQIYSIKSRISHESTKDDVDNLLRYARDKEDLILYHADYPEDLWVLGTSYMCTDLARFTTSDLLSHPFSVDPTFQMGQFEITPVVYKNLMLKSRRTHESPIALGPTMIHHRKTYDTYRSLAATLLSKCKGVTNAKGFVTDGEVELQRAFEDNLKNATSFRCFKHFEGNCKEKLREIGIRQRKDQRHFLHKVFGIPGKEEGILDAVDRKDLRSRLDSKRTEIETKERQVLQREEESYVPRYWLYLNDHYDMIRHHMVGKVRRKAGLTDGNNGKPLRSYTNCSESMNHVMKTAKDAFLKENPCVSHLSKLQFTKHVFEAIHAHQMEELQSEVAGVSDDYVLADHSRYLQVPADVWFEWSPSMRQEYLRKLQKLSIDDMFREKEVPWPTAECTGSDVQEFLPLTVNIAAELAGNFGYSKENATTLEKEVLHLINHPLAVQRKASIQTGGVIKFEVASASARNGALQVTVYSDHTACVCGRFRYDSIFKHSLAVAALQGILPAHLHFIERKCNREGRRRTALAEHDVNKATAGKKGGKNKHNYRPARGKDTATTCDEAVPGQPTFTAIHHNDNPFVLRFLHEDAKRCKACDTDFCHRRRVIPFDLIFEHKERWHYPVDGDWSNKRATQKETTRYYHTTRQCMEARFPYFNVDYVEIPDDVMATLRDSHKSYLSKELGLSLGRH